MLKNVQVITFALCQKLYTISVVAVFAMRQSPALNKHLNSQQMDKGLSRFVFNDELSQQLTTNCVLWEKVMLNINLICVHLSADISSLNLLHSILSF